MINKNSRKINYMDMGIQDYIKIWELQKDIQRKVIIGKSKDTLILVEHSPVYTLGKNADKNHLLQNRDCSIDVFDVERGGDITFHGPGQIVGYPILNLVHYKKSISWYMRTLEQIIIESLYVFGISAERKNGLTGVWVEDKKIAAQGVRISKWVTMHGFSLNVNTDLTFYEGIVPCGILHAGVTSMKELLGSKQDMNRVKNIIFQKFKSNLNLN